jgi:DNA-binding GntR family transcriptional regulator
MTAGDTSRRTPVHPNGVTLPALPRQQRVADNVYDTLRQAIIEGKLPPGSRLSVPLLAQQFDVSRSPVREAVQRLVSDGLATEEPHRGAGVAVLDPTELVPLYEIREVLEGLAARLAAQHASDDELEQLADAHREHAAALDRGKASHHASLDLAFHAQLRLAAHHPELLSYLERVQGRIAIAILGGNPQVWSRHAIKEHQAILDAVLARDPRAAEEAARAHVQRVRHDIATLNGSRDQAE